MKNFRKFFSILLTILVILSLLPAIGFAQEFVVLPEIPDESEAIGYSLSGGSPTQDSEDKITPSPAISGITEEPAIEEPAATFQILCILRSEDRISNKIFCSGAGVKTSSCFLYFIKLGSGGQAKICHIGRRSAKNTDNWLWISPQSLRFPVHFPVISTVAR